MSLCSNIVKKRGNVICEVGFIPQLRAFLCCSTDVSVNGVHLFLKEYHSHLDADDAFSKVDVPHLNGIS